MKPRSYYDHLIDEWIFNERDRAIMRRRILDGITFEKLAEEFELSVTGVKNIVKRNNIILQEHLD
jgi:hypothetical protein